MSCSYGVVHRVARICVIVNAAPDDIDRVDVLIDLVPTSGSRDTETVKIEGYYEDIKTVLLDDGSPYKIHRMVLTANKGSVVSAAFNGIPTSEHSDRIAMKIAKFVMWCESVHNDRSKALEDAVEISRLGSEDEENCGICLEEYEAGDMIGTLQCKHRYHLQCINNWLTRKEDCPLCRAPALFYNYLLSDLVPCFN